MTKSQWFRITSIAFIVGVGVAAFIKISWLTFYILGLASLVVIILFRNKKLLLISGMVMLFLLFGAARFQLSLPVNDKNFIGYYNGSFINVVGTIKNSPDIRDNHQKLLVSDIVSNKSQEQLKGNILLLTTLADDYSYNQKISFSCQMDKPEPINNFSYDKYLARFNVYSICAFPNTIKTISNIDYTLTGHLFAFKNFFKNNIEEKISEPEASLLLGIILGERKGLGDDLTVVFQRVGLSHLVALSGYNIAVLVGMLIIIGRNLYIPRYLLFYIITLGVFLFVVATGASPSVTRAGFMGWLVLLAYQVGRLSKPINLLLFAAVIMLIFNPKILFWDIGWQLSFLATFGLLYLFPLLNKRLSKLPNPLALREIITITLSAIVFTAPLVMWQFGGWSIIAPLVNVLVLPVIPLIMVLGLTAGIFGSFIFISFLWLWPLWLLLKYVILISEFFAGFSWGYMTIDNFSIAFVFIAYIIIFGAVFYLRKKTDGYQGF